MNKQKKILVIDDDADLVTFVTTLLQDNGYQTASAANGQLGLEQARAQHPDLILLDITMPEKSGVKCYRELRDDPALAKIPVVMVTGVTEDFKKFISTRKQVPPPDDYISKPFEPQLLLDTVAKLLPSK